LGVDLGEAPADVEETMTARAVVEIPDDLPRVVDAFCRIGINDSPQPIAFNFWVNVPAVRLTGVA
jgi:hypothetical protein